MNIAIHCNQFDGRGSGKFPYDFGIGIRKILGHKVIFITSLQNKNEGLDKLKSQFEVFTYDRPPVYAQTPIEQVITNNIIEKIVEDNKIDFIHLIKSGQYDSIVPSNCKTGVHCLFLMNEPHGNVYAGVSEQQVKRFSQSLYVPFVIRNLSPTRNIRKELNIPDDVIIVGRHGGHDTFNVSFVHETVKRILNFRKDIYFVFLATNKFCEHERIIYLPWTNIEQEIFNFIHSCDVMLHARSGGETFGSACGEFSVANKPVITWSGKGDAIYYDNCHVQLLGDKAILYDDEQDLMDILYSIDKSFINNNGPWDMYSTKFNENAVINLYHEVFLK